MPNVVEEIPALIRPDVDAALAWINAQRGRDFHVTGIVEPEEAVSQRRASVGAVDLKLVLCEGDLCVREDVRVLPGGAGFEAVADAEGLPDPPAELDPLPGVRSGWLDEKLGRHAFVVLLFYRGFW